jgi:hypothetical protein
VPTRSPIVACARCRRTASARSSPRGVGPFTRKGLHTCLPRRARERLRESRGSAGRADARCRRDSLCRNRNAADRDRLAHLRASLDRCLTKRAGRSSGRCGDLLGSGASPWCASMAWLWPDPETITRLQQAVDHLTQEVQALRGALTAAGVSLPKPQHPPSTPQRLRTASDVQVLTRQERLRRQHDAHARPTPVASPDSSTTAPSPRSSTEGTAPRSPSKSNETGPI